MLTCLNVLKADEWENLYNEDSGLNLKEAFTLHKYITKAYEMLTSKDPSK